MKRSIRDDPKSGLSAEFGGITQLLNSRNEINAKDHAEYCKNVCGK